jgi:hypothetical protein
MPFNNEKTIQAMTEDTKEKRQREELPKGKDGFPDYRHLPLGVLDTFQLRVGKHKGKRYSDMLKYQKEYSQWVLSKIPEEGSPLSLFRYYVHQNLNRTEKK